MLFSSFEYFLFFLPLTVIIYFYLIKKRVLLGAKATLIAASLIFYSWWNVIYLPLMLSSILFNYTIGSSISKTAQKGHISNKVMLILGIGFNLSLLAYFKYSDFFISNWNLLFDESFSLLHITLPLAISFFTFQQIAYLVDSYKGETHEYDFLNYTLFVTFFPQLIAGPIVHHKEMMPQFFSKWNLIINYKNIAFGLLIFTIGLAKKVLIADQFAQWANMGFDEATSLHFLEAWATSLSYTFQLYFDFSGYADMAVGSALLFNIKLPVNFNSPYKALSIQDFWRRWHITLSHFLRDYIFIPLGGSRKSSMITYRNLMVTFFIGGLWHGAGWLFVMWGVFHGVALIINQIWNKAGYQLSKASAWLITFLFVNATWVLFRANDISDAIKVFKGMVGLNGFVLPEKYMGSLIFLQSLGIKFGHAYEHIGEKNSTTTFIVLAFILIARKNSQEIMSTTKLNYFKAFLLAIIFFACVLTLGETKYQTEFLYFNF